LDFFVIYPSLNKNLLKNAFLPGAFFGFVCYATYDLTNLATIHGWPLKIVVIDLLWGAVVTGVVSLASCWLNSERKKNKFLFWK
jgi:uncharacterized membrane protein